MNEFHKVIRQSDSEIELDTILSISAPNIHPLIFYKTASLLRAEIFRILSNISLITSREGIKTKYY